MMNINVLVDRDDDLEWLKYTLDSFILISRANFSFNVCVREQHFQGMAIAYGISLNPGNEKVISIPRVNDYQPGDYSYIVAGDLEDSRIAGTSIPVFRKTFNPEYSRTGKTLLKNQGDDSCCVALIENGIKLSFDLFYNCFVHLSCLQEWEYEKRGYPIHSYAAKLNEEPALYQKPVVNYLFAILENTILLLMDKPEQDELFRKGEGFQICLTHDVDYIRKTTSLRTKRSAFYLSSGFREFKKVKLANALREIGRSFRFLFNPCDYWQFEYIQELEETYNVRSTFYFYAGVKRGQVWERFRRLIFDPGYNIMKNDKLQKKIRKLTENGWEVGLHGSFDSYNALDLLLEEKNRLEAISSLPVLGTRQHWLHLTIRDTWEMQTKAGIKVDTTLGFNDCIGFRAGIASPFYPYDFDTGGKHQIVEVPTVLMDGALFDHYQMESNESREKSLEILGEVKKFNGCVAINWHQRTPAAEYKWYWLYQEILSWVKENGGEGIPVFKVLEILDRDEDLLQRTS